MRWHSSCLIIKMLCSLRTKVTISVLKRRMLSGVIPLTQGGLAQAMYTIQMKFLKKLNFQ